MLRIRKRRAMLENSKQEDRQNNADFEGEVSTEISDSRSSVKEEQAQTPVIVNAGDHSDSETLSHKQKKRHRNNRNKSECKNDKPKDANPHILTAVKNAKKIKSKNEPVVQWTADVRHVKRKKLCNAAVEDSVRKRKKRKVDVDGSNVEANVLSWDSGSDSAADKIAHISDLAEMPSESSVCDLQHMEDAIVDDYVSVMTTEV